jgi:hypothetical protein
MSVEAFADGLAQLVDVSGSLLPDRQNIGVILLLWIGFNDIIIGLLARFRE